ncbi:MAG TPA: SDR family NAD(P)-dependent oxidoreductase [Anaerolineae bacterium]|nr:SDR family NAD(P)-dependent oxidoreductase [Anaerolineae bacterium]
MRLQNKVAIVTGATRGIGRAIAVRFGQEGASVAVIGRNEEKGTETVRRIEAAGSQGMFVHADVSDRTSVQAMVDAVVQRWGRIDILVNNAAICPFVGFLEMPEDLWEEVLDVNLKGYFLCSQAVARVMVEKGVKGRIIAVSSISAEFGGSQQAHYCASKAGINLLIKSMAISLGPHGITCNAVLPGTVETDINREALSDPEVRDYWVKRGPIGGLGQPEDIAGPVLFFASDDSAWCTGSMLVVDGGTSVNLQ